MMLTVVCCFAAIIASAVATLEETISDPASFEGFFEVCILLGLKGPLFERLIAPPPPSYHTLKRSTNVLKGGVTSAVLNGRPRPFACNVNYTAPEGPSLR